MVRKRTEADEKNYKNGKLDGLWGKWDEDGNITETKTYKNAKKVQ